jgi:protoporphyrinogen oxidase
MKRATIIGSGPAGLGLAYFLSERNVPCTIVSADEEPGGLAGPVEFAGRLVDPGPHSFYASYDTHSFALLNACFRNDELHTFVPQRAIRTGTFLVHAPFRPSDLLQPRLVVDAMVMYAQQRSAAKDVAPPLNARERVLRTRGRRFLDVLFEPWCLKHFGVSADRLDASLVDLLAAERRPGDLGTIVHPCSGAIGILWSRLARKLHERGVVFRWRTPVQGLVMQNDGVTGLITHGTTEPIDGPLFSSAPLHVTAAWLGMRTIAAPRRSTILVFMLVESYRTETLYLTDHRLDEPIGRITFVDNWQHPRPSAGPRILCAEFWCSPGDDIHDLPKEKLVEHVERYLQRMKVAVPLKDRETKVIGPVATTPIPLLGHAAYLADARTAIEGVRGLHPIGRHAGHRWDGIDDAVREAHELARIHAGT